MRSLSLLRRLETLNARADTASDYRLPAMLLNLASQREQGLDRSQIEIVCYHKTWMYSVLCF